MIRLEIGLEIRHCGVMSLCVTEDKTAIVVVVALCRSVSRNPVRFKASSVYHIPLSATETSQLCCKGIKTRPDVFWGLNITLKYFLWLKTKTVISNVLGSIASNLYDVPSTTFFLQILRVPV